MFFILLSHVPACLDCQVVFSVLVLVNKGLELKLTHASCTYIPHIHHSNMDPQPVNAETDLKVATKDTEDCCKIWFGGKKQQPFTTIHPLNYPPLKPIQIASSRMTRYFWVTAELTAVYDIKKVNQPCKTISICLQLQGSLIFSFIEMRKIRSTLPWRTALHSEWQ